MEPHVEEGEENLREEKIFLNWGRGRLTRRVEGRKTLVRLLQKLVLKVIVASRQE